MYKENIKEVERLITNYFEGIFYGDVFKLESCFHPSVHVFGDIKGADYLKSVREYLEGVSNRASPNDLNESLKINSPCRKFLQIW